MRIPSRSKTLLLLTLAFLSLPAGAQVAAQADRVPAAVDSSARVRIAGHVPAWAASTDARVADMGSVPDAQNVSLMFGVSRAPEVQAAFDQLLVDLQNPASPRYHQFLTPQQIGEQFGPTQHDLDALTTWLTGQGFHIDSVTPSRIFVQATAPAAVVSAALGSPLHRYSRQVGGKAEIWQAPTAEPAVPAALAPIVATIGGLVDVPRHSDLKILPPTLNTQTNIRAPQAGAKANAIHPDMTLSNGSHLVSPNDFAVLYDVSPVYSAGITGTGEKIMIIGGSRLYPQDLAYFEYDTGLASTLTNYYTPNYIVPPNQTDPGTTNDDNMGEGTLDFERSYATAPGATIDMVIGANWLSGTVSTQLVSYAINTVNDPILSMSFDSCEYLQGAANVKAEDTLYAQAAAQGISVFDSSGDAGVAGCESHGVAAPTTQIASISDICASGNVTCVGGTEFADTASPSTYWSSTNGTGYESAISYIPEGAWNEPTSTSTQGVVSYVVDATGGGPSVYIAKPSWQTGTGVLADGQRDAPDVSFSSSLHNAYFSCLSYSGASCVPSGGSFTLTGFGGTSATAPSMAGIAALLDQKLGGKQGNLNPKLYKIAASTPAAFHDATPASSLIGSACALTTPSMCNNSNPSPTALTGGIAGYALTTGYDLPTGLGSLDVSKFINAAASVASATVTVAATPAAINTSQTVVLKATVASTTTGTPTGTVVFTANGATVATATLSSGVATTSALSFTTPGTYAIVATYSGDTTFLGATGTDSLVVTATGTAKSTSTLTATATSLTTAQTAGFAATITGSAGTPTGTVQFTLDGAAYGSAVTLTGGTATVTPALLTLGSHTAGCTYSGDGNYAASTCNSVSLTVAKANLASTTTLTLTPTTIVVTTGTTAVAVTVSGSPVATPTGTITFYSGTSSLGTGTLSNGTAGTTLYSSTAGTYVISVVYGGDNIYAGSTSNAATLTVVAPAISLSPASTSLTQTAGGSSTDAVTVTSVAVSGTETLSCSVTYNGTGTATDTPSCSFSPLTLSFSGSGTATSTLTVYSTAASAAYGGVYKSESRGLALTGLGGAAFAGLLLLRLPRRGRRAVKAARLWSAMVFLAAGFATLSGCGSGGSSGSSSNPGTTKGSYTITATAAGTASATTSVGLTIQ